MKDLFENYVVSFFSGLLGSLAVIFALGQDKGINYQSLLIIIVVFFFVGLFCIKMIVDKWLKVKSDE